MMAQEIVTSIQEGFRINIVLLDNHGFSSIGGLSRACGNEGMGTNYRYRRTDKNDGKNDGKYDGKNDSKYDGDPIPVDFAANAASLGAWTAHAHTADELKAALTAAREQPRTSVVVVETSYDERIPGYESWWDVPIAEVSERDAVKAARRNYEEARKKERFFF
jgi:3D-(3,5/4)-trihydroxycyclohexane-1,2-dione acylhydrolase (decyclizing)